VSKKAKAYSVVTKDLRHRWPLWPARAGIERILRPCLGLPPFDLDVLAFGISWLIED
jgi:hypothetical protein